jgi:hypothetical protein
MLYKIFLLTVAMTAYPQTLEESQDYSALQLKTQVIKQMVCRDFQSIMLELKLKFIYSNIGKNKLILYKNGSIILKEMLARSKEDALNNKYEYDARLSWSFSGRGRPIESSTPDDDFIVLSPNESFEVVQTTRLILSAVSIKGERTENLADGEYYLQIKVSPWQSMSEAEILRNRWKAYGAFCSEPVTSEPMLIKVERPQIINSCSAFKR